MSKIETYQMVVVVPRRVIDALGGESHHRQARVVVAVSSRAAAIRSLDAVGVRTTAGDWRAYGSTLDDDHADAVIALAEPGQVFVGSINGGSGRRNLIPYPVEV